MVKLAEIIMDADSVTPDALRHGLEVGAQAVMGVYRRELVAALKGLRREFSFEVYSVVPNAPAYVRDLADLGMVGAALKRVRQLSLTAWPRLAMYGLRKVRGILAQDFGAMLGVMISMELPAFACFQPPVVFLHAQMTDLMLACGYAAGFQAFADLARDYGAEPGLQTRNFGCLLPRLDEWNVDISIVAAPFNPLGYGMRPSQVRCEELLAQVRMAVAAEDVPAGGVVAADEAAGYVREHSLCSVVTRGYGGVAAFVGAREQR